MRPVTSHLTNRRAAGLILVCTVNHVRNRRAATALRCPVPVTLPSQRCIAKFVSRRAAVTSTVSAMATAASVLALIRAASPQFRHRLDQLAFAVHAAVLTSGYRLVAVGEEATLEGLDADAPDADVTGWNRADDQYTFAYISDTAGGEPSNTAAAAVKLLVKALILGDTLLITIAVDSPAVEPVVMELRVDDYTLPDTDTKGSVITAAEAAKSYTQLGQLVNQVNHALVQLFEAASGNDSGQKKQKTGREAREGAGTATVNVREGQGSRGARPEADYDPLRLGPMRRPVRVGEEDIMPMVEPGGGPLPGGISGGPLLHGPSGGGMHVGPNHPYFAERMRHPELMPGQGLGGRGAIPGGPGVRWDPINPEGLEGYRPEDFQRPRPGMGPGMGPGRGLGGGPLNPDVDPDIGPPAPGRGADWDAMYG